MLTLYIAIGSIVSIIGATLYMRPYKVEDSSLESGSGEYLFTAIKMLVGTLCLLITLAVTGMFVFLVFLAYLGSCSPCRPDKISNFKSYLRRTIGDARLSLESTRDSSTVMKLLTMWHFRNGLIGFCQLVEYVSFLPSSNLVGPHFAYYDLYNNGPYPFMFGVTITDRDQCLELLYTEDQVRDNWFSNLYGAPGLIEYPFPQSMSTNDEAYKMARTLTSLIVRDLYRDVADNELFGNITPGCDVNVLTQTWNSALFYKLFGARMTEEEVSFYISRKRVFGLAHLPRPFHFLLFGDLALRRGWALRKYIAKLLVDKKVPRLAMMKQYAEDNGYDLNYVVRAAAYMFIIAGGAVVVRQMEALFKAQPEMKTLFNENPLAFVLESLRTNTTVALSGQLIQKEMKIEFDGVPYRIPKGNSVAASICVMNTDAKIFPDPMKIDITRQNQNENVVFSRLYDVDRPTARECPGRQLGPEMLVNVFTRYCV